MGISRHCHGHFGAHFGCFRGAGAALGGRYMGIGLVFALDALSAVDSDSMSLTRWAIMTKNAQNSPQGHSQALQMDGGGI